MNEDRPIALEAYEALAERYSQRAEGKAENGFIEHPLMRERLGEVSGLRVLDAGCGPGILSAYLLSKGASVVAFDVSPRMIALARERTKSRADLHVADMSAPLPFVETGTFDVVASSLAIDYVRDWSAPLGEFRRALKPGGRLVFTIQHPLSAYLWYDPPSAFGVRRVEGAWDGFGGAPVVMPDYYRSFAEAINPLAAAGFSIERLTDARPVEALKERDPERYEKYSRRPIFLCVEAARR